MYGTLPISCLGFVNPKEHIPIPWSPTPRHCPLPPHRRDCTVNKWAENKLLLHCAIKIITKRLFHVKHWLEFCLLECNLKCFLFAAEKLQKIRQKFYVNLTMNKRNETLMQHILINFILDTPANNMFWVTLFKLTHVLKVLTRHQRARTKDSNCFHAIMSKEAFVIVTSWDPGHDWHRQTDRQTDRQYIHPLLTITLINFINLT